MNPGDKVKLKPPGYAEHLHGSYVEDIVYDLVRIAVTAYDDNGKTKQLGPNQLYSYLAHTRDVEVVDGNRELGPV